MMQTLRPKLLLKLEKSYSILLIIKNNFICLYENIVKAKFNTKPVSEP